MICIGSSGASACLNSDLNPAKRTVAQPFHRACRAPSPPKRSFERRFYTISHRKPHVTARETRILPLWIPIRDNTTTSRRADTRRTAHRLTARCSALNARALDVRNRNARRTQKAHRNAGRHHAWTARLSETDARVPTHARTCEATRNRWKASERAVSPAQTHSRPSEARGANVHPPSPLSAASDANAHPPNPSAVLAANRKLRRNRPHAQMRANGHAQVPAQDRTAARNPQHAARANASATSESSSQLQPPL